MDLKQLNKLINLCRKQGISYIKLDNLELSFDNSRLIKQPRISKSKKSPIQEEVKTEISTESDRLTDDQLLFWSSDPLGNPVTTMES